jgi:hypothetical protein
MSFIKQTYDITKKDNLFLPHPPSGYGSAFSTGYCYLSSSAGYINIRKYDTSNFGLGAGRIFGVLAIYEY